MIDGATKYLKLAKFSLNHPETFESPTLACLIALLQFCVTVMIELANIMLLTATSDTISLISNFVAIIILADFDNYVFMSMADDPASALVDQVFTEKVFVIVHTTSKKCTPSETTGETGNRAQELRLI
jgi:hypothetical protein